MASESVFSCGHRKKHKKGHGEHYHRFPCAACIKEEAETEIALARGERELRELEAAG